MFGSVWGGETERERERERKKREGGRETERGRGREREREREREKELVTWCVEPSQPLRIITLNRPGKEEEESERQSWLVS